MTAFRLPSSLAAMGLVAAASVLSLSASSHPPGQPSRDWRLARLPRVLLWAWERPVRFPALPSTVGVAYLAGTLVLAHDDVIERPRLQPLVVSPSTRMAAVVRIEVDERRRPPLTDAQAHRAAERILTLASRPRVIALQIDFDATSRERPFYAALLARLRRLMPADWPLSITALASWCLGDPWIRDVPVDEAIPMLFRMGADGGAVRSRLDAGQDFSLAVCRASLGVSLDEPAGRLPSDRRRYVFNPKAWNERAVAQALELAAPVR